MLTMAGQDPSPRSLFTLSDQFGEPPMPADLAAFVKRDPLAKPLDNDPCVAARVLPGTLRKCRAFRSQPEEVRQERSDR